MNRLAATVTALALLAAARPALAEEKGVPDLSARPVATAPATVDLSLRMGAGDGMTVKKTVFGLPKNVGPVDRAFRVAVAATLVGIGSYRLANGSSNEALSWAMVGVAAVPASTGATGYCPLYQLLGIDNTF